MGKIFEDFRQVDAKRNRSVEGTGLGLAIVKHLVELMRGYIMVQSVYGEGTVVTITIPQKIVDRRSIAEVPEAFQAGVESVDTFTAPDVKVLVVDDNVVTLSPSRWTGKHWDSSWPAGFQRSGGRPGTAGRRAGP